MASTRTPLSGTIKISDLDKSITRYWFGNNEQNLHNLEIQDFHDGIPAHQPIGFAFCYGSPGTSNPNNISDYYNILGWVDYRVTATALDFAPDGDIRTIFSQANGSNGTGPSPFNLIEPLDIPNGLRVQDGAHWETMSFSVEVNGMFRPFDVYLEGNYIDTITADGYYFYDNGGVGYTNGPGPFVDITYII